MNDAQVSHASLAIRGEFTIFTAQPLKESLLETISAAGSDEEIIIDLSEVADIDTAGLQLMLMAKREATALGKILHFVRHSDEVLDLIDLCNLASEFGDPLLIRSRS